MNKGYGVDFLSDAFLKQAKVEAGKIVLPGGTYKALVVPDCQFMHYPQIRFLHRVSLNLIAIIMYCHFWKLQFSNFSKY